jgi:hypothetical protein
MILSDFGGIRIISSFEHINILHIELLQINIIQVRIKFDRTISLRFITAFLQYLNFTELFITYI